MTAVTAFGGCGTVTYEQRGSIVGSSSDSSTYELAVVSPASNSYSRGAMESALIEKGFIVVPSTVYRAILDRTASRDTVVVQCNQAGTTQRGLGAYSQKVTCTAVDFVSGDLVYEGRGEHMGNTAYDDFEGATIAALARLPRSSGIGRMISLHEAGNFFPKAQGKTRERGGERERASGERVIHTGTGFFVNRDGHVVTNAHVVSECGRFVVARPLEPTIDAELIAMDTTNDVAVLKVAGPVKAFARVNPKVVQGQYAATYGYPLAGTLADSGVFTDGRVNALSGQANDSRYVQMSVPVQQGNSGGPLVDARGNVIGIVTAKLNALGYAATTGDITQNVNFAIKTQMALAFLELHGVAYSLGSDGKDLEATKLVERLKEFVVQVFCE